jgi:hypothetical protein
MPFTPEDGSDRVRTLAGNVGRGTLNDGTFCATLLDRSGTVGLGAGEELAERTGLVGVQAFDTVVGVRGEGIAETPVDARVEALVFVLLVRHVFWSTSHGDIPDRGRKSRWSRHTG